MNEKSSSEKLMAFPKATLRHVRVRPNLKPLVSGLRITHHCLHDITQLSTECLQVRPKPLHGMDLLPALEHDLWCCCENPPSAMSYNGDFLKPILLALLREAVIMLSSLLVL